ncbi:hypothetical protein CEUSTIGMA_g2762.t1 [Chlamydomonas eustigma]|uniref:TOG domain-containing protein n=1 Tax=Chlamydomonas eustigma TaxID=1157962 RepID=A0A250WWV2_9CHLO|nr:hypothetical protein CEUSTIGMA_g2762.t1 [Chlamydomonas eustigma]|eukprot:GAX75317.1 hypothetical protein CEUSTIGMA_g2762.t1 [Chlamydomonas eustigma]
MSSIVADAHARLGRAGKERTLLWKTSLRTAMYDEDLFESFAADLVPLVIETLSMYHAPPEREAVAAFVKAACSQSPGFLKALTAAIVKLSSSYLSTGSSMSHYSALSQQQAYTILLWTCAILLELDASTAKKAVSKVVEIQAALLQRIVTAASASTACRPVLKLMYSSATKCNQLLLEFMELAKQTSSSPGAVMLLCECLTPATQGRLSHVQKDTMAAFSSSLQTEVLGLFCDRVIAGKEKPSAEILRAYQSLMKNVTEEEFSGKVLPALTRALKRVPEVALIVLSAFCQASELDLSSCAEELFTTIVQQLRIKESVRSVALDCLKGLSLRLQDTKVVSTVAASIMKILQGAAEGGKVKLPAERVALVSTLLALSASPVFLTSAAGRPTHRGRLDVDEIANALLCFYKEEGNEDVRLSVLRCLPLYLKCTCTAPEASLLSATLGSGVKDTKESVRRNCLKAVACYFLLQSNSREVESAVAAAVVEPCCKTVTDSLAKPALRTDGVLALLVAAQAAAIDTASTDAVLEREKMWSGPALKADSPLLSTSSANKLEAEDCVFLAHLCGCLGAKHLQRLSSQESSSLQGMCRLISLLLVHYSSDVRHAAQHAVACMVKQHYSQEAASLDNGPAGGSGQQGSNVGSSSLLLNSLCQGLSWAMTSNQWASTLLAPTSEATGNMMPPSMVSGRYSSALISLVKALRPPSDASSHPLSHILSDTLKSRELGCHDVAALMLASHHPIITSGLRTNKSSAWQAVCRVVPGILQSLPGMVTEVLPLLAAPLRQRVTEEAGEKVASPEVSAALLAVGSLIGMCPEAAFEQVKVLLTSILDREQYSRVSELDLEVFDTPTGVLRVEHAQAGLYQGEVVVSKTVKKTKTGRYKDGSRAFAVDDDEDDDLPSTMPSKSLASSKAAAPASGKGGAKDASVRQAEQRLRLLAEEAAVREHVRRVKEKIELGLSLLASCVSGNKAFAALRLEEYQSMCLPFLASELVGAAACDAVRVLASCMPGRLGVQSLSLSSALRMVMKAIEKEEEEALLKKKELEKLQDEGSTVGSTSQCGVTNGHDDYSVPMPVLVPTKKAKAPVLALQDLPRSQSVADVVHALKQVSTASGNRLSPPSYRFIFPVLKAVLSSPVHTSLHDDALSVVAQHCGGAAATGLPRQETLQLLYHALGVIPAYRDRINPLLSVLCSGVEEEDIPAALTGLTSSHALVRSATLSALSSVPMFAEGMAPPGDLQCILLYMACSDVNEENKAAATELWEKINCILPSTFAPALVSYLSHEAEDVRNAAASSLAAALKERPESKAAAIELVLSSYSPTAALAARLGVALALSACGSVLEDEGVTSCLEFLIRMGLADRNEKVRGAMVSAGMVIVDSQGASHSHHMLPLFEGFLEHKKANGSSPEDEARYDVVREGVVVYLGTLGRHLPPADPKRQTIVETLISVLNTPSESVQRSVSTCLPPLIQSCASDKSYLEALVSRLMSSLTKGSNYGERRGAAFGIAGIVKGLGIMAMKNYGIMDTLKTAVEDKKEASSREGALLAFECLSEKLGKLFEPYIIYILPLLLACFGDVVPVVRQATEEAARMIMGQLTASGVKLVLPALLKGLEDKVWRTKQGSVQLLGSMAYCAPKQLGSCLPTIVPRLSEVLSDPHPKVQSAAQEALQEIGSVIRNPEVQALVPHLLAAIAEPNVHTRACLDVLLQTVFVNTIDAPSLALIVPVVHRGLRDRAGDTKRRAARIVGNMCTLINDPKDMTPYVPILMPELQKSLVDPLPEVRAVSARAMGSLLKGMGSETFSDLVPWLMATLRSDAGSVERSGAAQGLAEVLSVLGTGHMEVLLPDILEGCKHRVAHQREGHLTLFQFLPITLEALFQPYLGRVLPSILDGLADENEGVREAALSAGRIFVDHYANTALVMLLPAVEEGIFNDNWRIRQSSVLLMGKLLFKVVGTSGNIVLDGGSDDEGAAEEHYAEAIIAALGMERRNQVLSRLYITRSDPQYTVRNEALHVWKTVVVNTPKTLLQILPVLMSQIISALASNSEDRRIMAARCTGELCRKMGERVLSRIMPILRDGIHSEEAGTRQGVCLGLKEVLENISKHQLAEHLSDVLPTVQAALTDTDGRVRAAAGDAFAILFKGGSGSAVDSVVPSMIAGLESEAKFSESLEGLRVIQIVRPTVFNFVLPKLMKQPMQLNNIKALAVLCTSAGHTLNAHVGTAIPKLLALANKPEEGPREVAAKEAAAAFAAAVQEDGLHLLISEMHRALEDPEKRRASADLIAHYFSHSKLDFMEHIPLLMDAVVSLLGDEDPVTLQALWKAMESIANAIPKEDHHMYVRPLKEAVASAMEKERRKRRNAAVAASALGGPAPTASPLLVAGFCLPKALAPVVPIYLSGVLQGSSNEVREMASEGLGELVEVTGEEALKPFVVQITGPLIRIIGDRFPSSVKAAILLTLGSLIAKAGGGMKPFVPQLQTTFMKCLIDPYDVVRSRAAKDLGELSRLSARVDQLASELITSARSAEPEIRCSFLHALRGLLLNSGDRLSANVLETVGEGLRGLLPSAASAGLAGGEEEGQEFRLSLAACLGAHAKFAGRDQMMLTLQAAPFGSLATGKQYSERMLAVMVLGAVVFRTGHQGLLDDSSLLKRASEMIKKSARDEDVYVRVWAGKAASRLAIAQPSTAMEESLTVLAALLGPDQSSGVQQQALVSVKKIADVHVTQLEPYLSLLMPLMCALLNNTSGPTKQACERTICHVLQLQEGLEVAQRYLESGPGPSVRTTLTEATLRRLQKIRDEDDGMFGSEEF